MCIRDRRYNALYAANGAMKTHTTMTGAKTDFEYEPNSLVIESLSDSVQIGVRIKSITTTDMVANRKQTRQYRYSRPVCSIDFTQVGITPFVSLSGLSWVAGSGIQIREDHNLSAATLRSSRLPGTPLSSARIFYGEAVEEVSGTGIDRPVRTEYEYDTSGCTLRRVGGSGEARTSNSLYIKGDMTMPSPRRENADRLFNAGFANYYFAECNYAEPRLRVRRQMQWENGAYHPMEQKEYHYSLVDSAAYYTGLYVEPLVKDFRDQIGTTKTTYDNIRDFVYMQTAMLSGRWRLDSVAGKRWYGTGAGAIVAKSGTGYRYTKRYFTISGDNVPWARSKSPLSRIQQINPGGSITIVGTGSKVFGDSVSNSSAYEMLIGTVTHLSLIHI